jgi:precorrin-6A/cobalt-precorrin-6A reductase
MARLLLLGGTREAVELAERVAGDPGLHAITSLAGRTHLPAQIPGEVRVGGFGGAKGLGRFLADQAIDLVVDATHPFATRIAHNAAQACGEAGVPRLKLLRPAWRRLAGDRWIEVTGASGAAAALPGLARRFFLTTGRGDITAFASLAELWFLVRLVTLPETPLPLARHELICARGPFDEAAEIALMQDHRIQALVAKNSGGVMTYAKIAAARRLGLPVVMIRRPRVLPGETVETVETVDQALAWIATRPG